MRGANAEPPCRCVGSFWCALGPCSRLFVHDWSIKDLMPAAAAAACTPVLAGAVQSRRSAPMLYTAADCFASLLLLVLLPVV
jgi:hypothetical protein